MRAVRVRIADALHAAGALNPDAHMRKTITLEQAMRAKPIAEPLNLYDCSLVSDGAAAVLLAPLERAREFAAKPVRVLGIAQCSDYLALDQKADITTFPAVRRAGEQLLAGGPDMIVLSEEIPQPLRRGKERRALLIIVSTLAAAASGWLPIAETLFLGGVILIVTNCLSIEEAYAAIEWRSVVLVGGMLSMGLALTKTGAANMIASYLATTLERFGPLALLGGFLPGDGDIDPIHPGWVGHATGHCSHRHHRRAAIGRRPPRFCHGGGAGHVHVVSHSHGPPGECAGDGPRRVPASRLSAAGVATGAGNAGLGALAPTPFIPSPLT